MGLRQSNGRRGGDVSTRGAPAPAPAEKLCASCGRRFAWQRRLRRNWSAVRYCSAACRARRVTGVDRALEAAIEARLGERAAGASICPSEAARAVARARGLSEWRPLMEPARRAARRLVATGRAVVTQGGQAVDATTARGPIRIRAAEGGSRGA